MMKNNYDKLIWIKKNLKDIVINFIELVIIHCDNTGIFRMSKNSMLYSKTHNVIT